ncbi:hypothetical protein IP92_04899 [Pseudoduganella flava]|uniref:PepSY domain-containing protein n=1 Tax=Pseudoduganella flava TaxID=871742 RepID=A0A562PHE3_9BURK|nr:hypothetical protein [Pseudoduganella flava]QGZ42678.1 hypothetical protein GO485_29035 [Pseudoduganella flava]TWI43844.1 hypothetical protein IP92_04899 [Pseudoduganella flava]
MWSEQRVRAAITKAANDRPVTIHYGLGKTETVRYGDYDWGGWGRPTLLDFMTGKVISAYINVAAAPEEKEAPAAAPSITEHMNRKEY